MQIRPLNTIFGGASWYLAEKLIRLAGAFLISAWVARYLGPQQYGTFVFGVALIAMLGFLGSLGVESLVVRDLVQFPERESRIVSTYFFLRLVGAVAVPFLACGYIGLAHQGDGVQLMVVAVLSSVALFASFDVADCWLQARHRSRSTSLVRIGGFCVGAVVKILLVVNRASLFWFACANAAEAAAMATAYYYVLKQSDVRISWRRFDREELRRLLLDGKGMILSGLTVIVYSKIDVLAVGTLISKDALGSYGIAAAMCGAWNIVGTSLAQAYAPHISAARKQDFGAYVAVMRRFLSVMLGLSVAGSLVLAMLSSWIFAILLGPAYVRGGEVFSLLVWSSVPVFLGVATSQIIVNEQLYWTSFLRTTLGMVTSLALIVPAASNWGVTGVAVLVVASSCIATTSVLFSSRARQILYSVCTPVGRDRNEA